MATTVIVPLPRSVTPRLRTPRSTRSTVYNVTQEYDPRLDDHQQTYVLSPRVMTTLTKAMKDSNAVFTSPSSKVGFHGPRRPLLLSYPVSPSKVGKASFHTTYGSRSATSRKEVVLPADEEGKDGVKLAYNMRTGESQDDHPGPKNLPRPSTVPKSTSKTRKLAREKGFVLDGIAISSIQDDYGKIQPKMGPAIPPYNAHFDPSAKSYFTFKGLDKTLRKTGQSRRKSESNWGRAVDRFHYVGFGHDYLFRRNLSGAGYSRDFVDGHDQFLSHIRPIDGYHGRFGYRRNTPSLRSCPSPFGTATRSSLH